MEPENDINSHNSTLRERIVEHVFVGEVLRRLWQAGIVDVEVLRSEFDAGGYDLVLSYKKIVRHIQLKTSSVESKSANVTIGLELMNKPSGCVLWIIVDKNLEIKSYRWFGDRPGVPLPDINQMKVAKHSKGNADGVKNERPHHRTIKRSSFTELTTLDEVLCKLFDLALPTPAHAPRPAA